MRCAAKCVVGALAVFLCLEGGLRIAGAINPQWVPVNRGYLRFLPAPGGVVFGHRLNSRGFNDIEYRERRPGGTYRILAVGDSTFFSVVPYRYGALTLVEERFNRNGKRVEILNMGIPSIGPREYYSLLLHEGLRMNPDMLMVGFFIGDDLCEGRANRMLSHIRTYGMLKALTGTHALAGGSDTDEADFCDRCPTFDRDTYVGIEAKRVAFFQVDGTFPEYANHTAHYYRKMKELCDHRGIPMLVVIIPTEMQLYPLRRGEAMKRAGVRPQRYDFMLPNRIMGRLFDEAGIAWIDLTPPMVQRARGGAVDLYLPRNTHWNIAGNAAFAGFLYDGLDRFMGTVIGNRR
ncbi:MAG: hypothetical protein JXA20_00595 [Spirochaetes bacterium]|nr:hypothetical protein [Spirochaetota bacterium]